MKDLLQQAINELTPSQRAECNWYLASIQNDRNARHRDEFCDLPSSDLIYALWQFHERTLRMAEMTWDDGYLVKGLA